jgi:phospholipid transport system transporter-binding protein
MFESGSTLTHATAMAALEAGLARIAAGAVRVNCAGLTQFDSSALAVMMAWRRAAFARGATLVIEHLPAGLLSLAQAYGVDALLHDGA